MSIDADTRAFDAALAGRAPSDEEIASLLAFADRLVELAATVQPRPDFSSALRSTLVTDAATMPTPAPPRRAAGEPVGAARLLDSVWGHSASQSRRRLGVVLAAFVTALGLGGLNAGSAAALPGDTLYPAKRFAEGLQLTLKNSDSARGAFLLELATRRLAETEGLSKRTAASSDLKAATLDDYSDQIDDGADTLVKSFRATDAKDDIVSINRFATVAAERLAALDDKVSGPAADSLRAARSQLASIIALTTDVCPECGGIDPQLRNALTSSGVTAPPATPSRASQEAPPAGPAPTPVTVAPPVITPVAPIDDTDSDNDDEQDEAEESDDESDDSEDSARAQRREQVQALPAPVAVPTTAPAPLPPAEGKRFHCDYGVGANARTVTCTLDNSGHPLWKFTWDFGDGQTSTGRQVQHTYAGPGTYTVKMTGTLGFDLMRDQTTITIR